jgi:alpha-N-arabinofuranosidase
VKNQKNRVWTLALLSGLIPVAVGAKSFEAEVSIQVDKPGHMISRHIYGQFAEHLGRGIYEGVWVGENSPIPNTRGIRKDVVAALKELQVPVVRWPGGCFADEYHWREGIGPRNKRPVKINTHWGGVEETNAFGTHEFFDFLELIGAEAYIAGNLGSGSPQEMAEWLEYMTSNTQSTLANLRRQNGRDKPWKVAFFGVGNETWGCGGNMRPEYYADLYRQFATFLKAPGDNSPKKIASGGNDAQTIWTEVLAKNVKSNMDGISHHYYTIPTGDWSKKGNATGFGEEQWISSLYSTLKIDGFIQRNRAMLDKHDPAGKVGLYLDEWGTWYDPEPGKNPGFLYQQNTLRDAVIAALNFNVFHKHADRVHMANIAQMVNVLQALILTDKEKMVLTPTYHAFALYKPFQDASFLPLTIKAPDYKLEKVSVPALSASAARGKDDKLYLALVNLDPRRSAVVSLNVSGSPVTRATGRILTAPDMDSHNSFTGPAMVVPVNFSAMAKNGNLQLDIPQKSVVVVAVD